MLGVLKEITKQIMGIISKKSNRFTEDTDKKLAELPLAKN